MYVITYPFLKTLIYKLFFFFQGYIVLILEVFGKHYGSTFVTKVTKHKNSSTSASLLLQWKQLTLGHLEIKESESFTSTKEPLIFQRLKISPPPLNTAELQTPIYKNCPQHKQRPITEEKFPATYRKESLQVVRPFLLFPWECPPKQPEGLN